MQGFRQGGGGGRGSPLDPPYSAPQGGGVYLPLVGRENKNIFLILLSFQLK